MAMRTIGEYPTIIKDSVEKFNGNQLVLIYWQGRFLEGSVKSFPLPPEMPFGAIASDIIPAIYKIEPSFKDLDFDKTEVIWEIDGKVVTPDFSKSLKENGVGHKSFIKLITPTLSGKIGA